MRKRIKKKNITLFLVGILFIVLLIFGLDLFLETNKVKKQYNKYVIVNKDTNLYNSKKNKIGKIYKDTYLELDKYNNGKYFKIKDKDYYVYYSDIKKTKKQDTKFKDYYVMIGKVITLKDNAKYYYEDKLSIKINKGNTYDVMYLDDNYYYIKFLNRIYGIKKEDVKKEKDIEVAKKDFFSILFYEGTNDNIDSQFKYLKENGNFGITMEDFTLWLNDKININKNGILVLSQNEEVIKKAKEYGIYVETNFGDYTYNGNNSSCKKGTQKVIPRYQINSETNNEMLKKILDGEPIVYIDLTTNYAHNIRSEEGNASSIAVLNYHFFYDSSLGENCGEGNCMDVKDFERELYWLKENNFKTLTIDEFIKWMYGEIELPNRSVLLTVDDGAMGTGIDNGNKLMPLLEKYNMHATLFLISGWHKYSNYISPNLDVESHTYNMHEGGYCSTEERGSKLLCSSLDEIKNDLAISKYEIGTDNAFCYPMYVYNDKVITALKEMGYKVAFTGGGYKASRDDDKYKIPRYHIYDSTSLDDFIDMIN